MKTVYMETVDVALKINNETVHKLVDDLKYVEDNLRGKAADLTLRRWDDYRGMVGWHVDISSDSEAVTALVTERVKAALQGAVAAVEAYALGKQLAEEIAPDNTRSLVKDLMERQRDALIAHDKLYNKVLYLEDAMKMLETTVCDSTKE